MSAPSCVECGLAYSRLTTGTFGCFAHSGTIDAHTRHYRCCRKAASGCTAHTEYERWPGCVEIDHAETREERRAILSTRPFECVALRANMRTVPNGVYITEEHQLEDTVTIPVPWGEPVAVNVPDEHAVLARAISTTHDIDLQGEKDDPYTYFCAAEETRIFVPFVIIPRVAPQSLAHRMSGKARGCVYYPKT